MTDLGWSVLLRKTPSFNLNPSIKQRYPLIPIEVTNFLSRIEFCKNQQETVWFMSESDYNYKGDDTSFWWNEFERISLDAAGKDNQWRFEIESFWNNHFPVLLSVFSEYAYIAVDVSKENFGAIVVGVEPEFEEITVFYPNLEEFFTAFVDKLRERNNNYELWMIKDESHSSN